MTTDDLLARHRAVLPSRLLLYYDEPMEIVLWAEEPVVSTRAVPAERVRVLRTQGSQQQDLTTQLRRERASFDNAPGDESR